MIIDQRLIETVSRTFDLDPSRVSAETSPGNTPAWDSVGHLNLILELEEVFQIRFSSEEIPEVNSVERLQQAITRRATDSR
jgi:acyl carrier protein